MIVAPWGEYVGTVRAIGEAWKGGPEVILYTCEHAGVYPKSWLSHMLADGYRIVCPD